MLRAVASACFVIWSEEIRRAKKKSLDAETGMVKYLWPLITIMFLIFCELLPLIVLMYSAKPAPDTAKNKTLPVPKMNADEHETTIDVIDL